MSKPITPSEVGAAKAASFPPAVFQAFNELIATHWVDGRAIVKQEDVINRVIELTVSPHPVETEAERKADCRASMFNKGWLNIEEAYRAAGWKVEYDKPAYNETYPATFTFTKARVKK